MTRTVCGVCGWDRCRCGAHHGYVIGAHWLETAYSRVCAGEDEAEVLRDYGWVQGNGVLRRENERLRKALTVAAKAELYDPATGVIDADVLEIVQDVARAALRDETAIWSARHDPRG